MLTLSLAWAAVVTALISRALRQRGLFHDVKDRPCDGEHATVAVIVPARNEEHNIKRCLRSLLAQHYPVTIIAIDDNSSDRTAEIISSEAADCSRLSAMSTPPLPPGWTGKSHACWVAAEPAAKSSDWLCFVDADIEASAGLIGAAVSLAVAEGIDFLSLTPRQVLVSFPERLILPCGLYLLAFSQDLGKVNSPASINASATGQFILVKSAVYCAIGGHRAVKKEICEDVALANLTRRQGFKVALYGGTELYSTRMYTGWRSLWPGITKNLVEMLGGPGHAVLATVIALILAWAAPLLPAIDAGQCIALKPETCLALSVALPASFAAFAFHLAGAIFFRIPFWYGLIFPLGYTIGAILALDSIRRRLTGRILWKGRTYP